MIALFYSDHGASESIKEDMDNYAFHIMEKYPDLQLNYDIVKQLVESEFQEIRKVLIIHYHRDYLEDFGVDKEMMDYYDKSVKH
jgi:hypothetical protein